MSRKARIVFTQELYHVTQRGNYKQPIFQDDKDKVYYLKLLQENKTKHELKLYAFCLMPNHVHLIVEPSYKDSLALTIGRTHQQFSTYMHRKNELSGHLWQERFYSCLLLGGHVVNALRYVDRNPVRANLVEKPWDYVWSSARAHLGLEYKIINLERIESRIGKLDWKEFIEENEDEEELRQIRLRTNRGSIYGPQDKIQEIELKLGKKVPCSAPRGRPRKNNWQ